MGRRGGKRRRRRHHYQEDSSVGADNSSNNDVSENVNQEEQPQSLSKRPRIDASPNSQESKDEDLIQRQEVKVTCHGACKQNNNFPPPLMVVREEEHSNDNKKNDDNRSSLYARIWKYLGKGNPQISSPTLIQQHLWSIMGNNNNGNNGTNTNTNYNDFHTIGIAPTGSGKTLAYGLPTILSQTTTQSVLVLAPTRELVQQIGQVYTKLAKAYVKVSKAENTAKHDQQQDAPQVRVVLVFGGSDRTKQKQDLLLAAKTTTTTTLTIVVATPGRLLDLLSSFEDNNQPMIQPGWIVLDEADQLAKDGDLGPQVHKILDKVSSSSQSSSSSTARLALLSATYPRKVHDQFQKWVGSNYVLVEIDSISPGSSSNAVLQSKQQQSNGDENGENKDSTQRDSSSSHGGAALLSSRIPKNLKQVLHVCADHKKPRKLVHTLQTIRKEHKEQRNAPLGIIFFAKIEKVKYISKLLEKEGIPNVQLHSQLSTQQRQGNLHSFAVGKRPLLLATDLAARGIDIPAVKFVVQYDFPGNLQQYVHRCGRAGRPSLQNTDKKEQEATVYSFFTRNLKAMASDMVKLLEANNAWVDPNLKALTVETPNKKEKSTAKKSGKPNIKKNLALPPAAARASQQDDDDDDDFQDLAPNRIVLKRASHVSDASESSDSSDSDDDEM